MYKSNLTKPEYKSNKNTPSNVSFTKTPALIVWMDEMLPQMFTNEAKTKPLTKNIQNINFILHYPTSKISMFKVETKKVRRS
jgi:hypothetical protein